MKLGHLSFALIALVLGAAGCGQPSSQQSEKKLVTYKAQGPDGKIYSIRGPEGLPREVVLAEIKRRAALLNSQNSTVGCAEDCDASYRDERRNPYQGDVQLNYGNSRYGDPTYRYRGEVESDGYVRVRNLNGDTLRGYVESDGSVRLRNYDGDTYRGQVDSDGSMKLRDYDGSTLSGQIDQP